ncbi:hypothetical protein EDEG_01695 [Edhazardia aedis USNM 41457]|uniref:Uncharacterized protein n=1 Tax=Edhazardia aedis (strain USNM 41457) TaxID=1003232 RepID=J9DRR6_EDHAE|nr:hypothetical protein EDEG_01695 [Edhazardia aedis USNM 41457]|eukprot:EJW04012.1 hypothetical protein EDEG_01695 [Edhazardia aedis USNM 41457]
MMYIISLNMLLYIKAFHIIRILILYKSSITQFYLKIFYTVVSYDIINILSYIYVFHNVNLQNFIYYDITQCCSTNFLTHEILKNRTICYFKIKIYILLAYK